MRTKILAAVTIAIALAALWYASANRPGPASDEQTNGIAGIARDSNNAGQIIKAEELPHPVSLPALTQKDFDGRDLNPGRVLAQTENYTRYFITYKSGELTISGIMNVPKGTPPAGGFPVLILNHGYIDPAVYTNGRGLRREQYYLASRGYIVIHPDYRNHAQSDKDPDSETKFRLGYAEDVINLIYAVKNSPLDYFNKEKIGMLGHSMGGGVSLNVMVTQPDLVNAYVLFAPVSADYRDNFTRWIENRPEMARKIIETYGSPEQEPEFWNNLSAINFLNNIQAPVIIHHGTADDSVPLEWSQELELAMKETNKDITLYVYPNQPHEFTSSWSQVMARTVEFFDRHLKTN